MSKIKNESGEDRLIYVGLSRRLVLRGQAVEVPAADVYGYTQQSIWSPADDEAQRAHDEGEAAYQERLGVVTAPEVPARNASADAWREYAVAAGLATETDVAGLSRDDLIQQYGPQEG